MTLDGGSFGLRLLGDDEDEVLRDAAYQAAVWWEPSADRPHPSRDELFAQPAYGLYVDGWGRQGDRALVAHVAGQPLGVAWYRTFSAAAPSYGYVAEDTPELGIAVLPWARGAGVGGALLAGLIVTASLDGFPALSLSVSQGNPARRLYERSGFTPCAETSGSTTMLRPLGRLHPPEKA